MIKVTLWFDDGLASTIDYMAMRTDKHGWDLVAHCGCDDLTVTSMRMDVQRDTSNPNWPPRDIDRVGDDDPRS